MRVNKVVELSLLMASRLTSVKFLSQHETNNHRLKVEWKNSSTVGGFVELKSIAGNFITIDNATSTEYKISKHSWTDCTLSASARSVSKFLLRF
jgi:hypothetical protein